MDLEPTGLHLYWRCTELAKDAFFVFFFEMVVLNAFCVLLLFLHRNSISFSSNEPMSQEKVKKINHNKSLEIKSLNNNKSLTLHYLSLLSIYKFVFSAVTTLWLYHWTRLATN